MHPLFKGLIRTLMGPYAACIVGYHSRGRYPIQASYCDDRTEVVWSCCGTPCFAPPLSDW